MSHYLCDPSNICLGIKNDNTGIRLQEFVFDVQYS